MIIIRAASKAIISWWGVGQQSCWEGEGIVERADGRKLEWVEVRMLGCLGRIAERLRVIKTDKFPSIC